MKYPQVLVVEDDLNLQQALMDTLAMAKYQAYAVDCAEAAIALLGRQAIDLVVTDVNMPGMSGHQLLAWLREQKPHIPVILMTAYGCIEQAVDAMQQGAADYLVKPFDPDQLLASIAKTAGQAQEQDAPVAQAASSLQLLDMARRVAATDTTVLIGGESGTGKEVLARYIHNQSPRAKQRFIAINCAAIPDNMLEATLFGHEKGAFTGAISSQPGKFEQANGGTLLLDEISEMPLSLQAKLLRVLQEREIERIGGRKTIALDVRVLATSNRLLRDEVAKGNFREDLYYRLNVVELSWQPLRERVEDIEPLALKLLAHHSSRMGRSQMQFSGPALSALLTYAWPGNIRELDNAIQRALIFARGQLIGRADLNLPGLANFSDGPEPLSAPSVTAPLPQDTFALAQEVSDDSLLQAGVKRHELELIVQAIGANGGRKKEAAEQLGISPRTLRYKLAKMRELGLDVDQSLAQARVG